MMIYNNRTTYMNYLILKTVLLMMPTFKCKDRIFSLTSAYQLLFL